MSQPEGNDGQERKVEASQDDNQRNAEHEGRRLGTSVGQSESAGDVKDTTSNPTGERGDSDRHVETDSGKASGGILRQLIEEHEDQLAEYRAKLAEYQSMIEKLEQRRRQLLTLYEQLQVETGEGEEEKLPEDEAEARSEEE